MEAHHRKTPKEIRSHFQVLHQTAKPGQIIHRIANRIKISMCFTKHDYICIAFHPAAWSYPQTEPSFPIVLLGHKVRASLGQTEISYTVNAFVLTLPQRCWDQANAITPVPSQEGTDTVYHKCTCAGTCSCAAGQFQYVCVSLFKGQLAVMA